MAGRRQELDNLAEIDEIRRRKKKKKKKKLSKRDMLAFLAAVAGDGPVADNPFF